MSNQFKIRLAARQFPATFVAFDCLYLDGEDITIRKLTDRKDALHFNTVNEGGRMALFPRRGGARHRFLPSRGKT